MNVSSHPAAAGSRSRRIAGQSLVEFGLVLPLLLLIFAAAVDFGRVFYGYVALENAVKEGAQYGARNPLCDDSSTRCPNPDNVIWRVQEEARTVRNPDGTGITPTSACLDGATGVPRTDLRTCVAGDTYTVTATYRLNLITPLLGTLMGSGFTMSSRAQAKVLNEAFDPTPGLAPTKLVRAADARNRDEIRAKCAQPDPTGSPDYYRAPCLDTTATGTVHVSPTFRTGDTIAYKVTVINNGGTTVTGITATDSQGWPAGCTALPTTMPVGGTPWMCSYSRTAPAVAGSATTSTFENVLTVDGLEIDPTADAATVTIERPPANLVAYKYVSPYRNGADGDGWISGVATFGTAQALTVHRPLVGGVDVWFKIIVVNQGAQTATGVTIVDTWGPLPYGQSSATAVCDAAPTTLAVNGRFECRYRATISTNGAFTNTVTATATNVTFEADDDNSATVTAQACGLTQRIVPNLVGLTKTQAQTAWTTAGFTGAITNWSSNNSAVAVAQNRQAFSCMAPTTTITISRTNT